VVFRIRVAVLDKDGPLPAHCALLQNTTGTLNPQLSCWRNT